MEMCKAMRKAREAAGLTMMELAGRAGVHLRTLEMLERGLTTGPRLATLVLLCDVLGITLDEYVGRELPAKREE